MPFDPTRNMQQNKNGIRDQEEGQEPPRTRFAEVASAKKKHGRTILDVKC